MINKYIISHKEDEVEIYEDPRLKLRFKKDKKKDKQIITEIHHSRDGRLSISLDEEVLRKLINEIDW
ncbi:hypothetical protein [Virgibacillus salexigens]|uniref:Uncharacterized protein n=1 Tax=Virgibacillus kapii TaxID=1638645 RepID=A0ABQ2DYB9_9BACI|nr:MULTISPECIES: hypothetical protein [Virgibacillus]MYL43911.1 hypothetical protein [Virgibacillus massiliensis]GGJ77943.1 hypothetical protein GCM10007111_44290 [Virgibacillus kapii]